MVLLSGIKVTWGGWHQTGQNRESQAPPVESAREDGFYSTCHRKPAEAGEQGGDESELCFKRIASAAESGFLGNKRGGRQARR